MCWPHDLPGIGLLSGNLEGYGAQNRFQSGTNFLELRGAPWMGQHWTIEAGDFRQAGIIFRVEGRRRQT